MRVGPFQQASPPFPFPQYNRVKALTLNIFEDYKHYHTALRAPPWAFTQHIVSTNVLSSPRGIGILAQSPTARPEGKEGDARVGPPHTH